MKKILVIEDDCLTCASIMVALRRKGYEVVNAGDASTGFAMALTERPHLILSDVHLPDVSGVDLLKKLRARPDTSAIPVILMTGAGNDDRARSSMNLGADDFLEKPFTMDVMIETVSARLERQDCITRVMEAKNEAERITAAEKIRLQSTALEAAANGIVIADARGVIVWVNQAFARLTGYSAQEAIGQNPRILKSDHQPPQFFAQLWRTIASGDVWRGELVNRRKDGSLYDEEMTITPVLGYDGKIQHYIAIKQDITERKKVEQSLADKRDLLRCLMDNLPDYIYFKDINSRFTRINDALAKHLGVPSPDGVIGKSDADYFPIRQARQKLVDERRLLATGQAILGLVEKSDTATGPKWVSSTKVPIYGPDGQVTGLVGISRDITETKHAEEELRRKSAFLEAQLNSSIDGILVVDEEGKKCLQNQRMTDLFSVPRTIVDDPDDEKLLKWVTQQMRCPESFLEKVRYLYLHPDEVSQDEIELTNGAVIDRYSAPMKGEQGEYYGRIWTFRDITKRKQAELERQRMEVQLRQAQKLESIGQLAAGIAHEINTPAQYVGDNTGFIKDSFTAILNVLKSHEELLAAARAGTVSPDLLARATMTMAASDLDYLRVQIPLALKETLEGVGRVTKIVRAMKEFSHPGGKEKSPADLNKAIESTVTVARNEWKYLAELKLDLDPNLPFVSCFLGEFNQVILNLIVNATHAIADVIKSNPGSKGLITIQTRRDGDSAEIRVTDTGTGIPEAVRPRIFEPFFTTKAVGKGTGQGLAMVYGTVVNRHGGNVTFESEVGRGTTFIISLPMKAETRTKTTNAPAAEPVTA